MSLLVDSKCPLHQSAVPVPQLTTEPKDDPAHTQPLERIKQIAADIMGAALAVKANRERCLKLAWLVLGFIPKVRDILQGRWDPPPHIIKSALGQLEWFLTSISSWMSSLVQAKPLWQVLKKVQINNKIDELQISLIDHISSLQDAVFKEVRRTSRLNALHVGVPSFRDAYFVHEVGVSEIPYDPPPQY
ncbi:hypothetical protein BC827DRAFT_1243918 [Russula dissimulans]|nr:hypothetical protein BC827DRAFT_1243918 [Russula dissimulans]